MHTQHQSIIKVCDCSQQPTVAVVPNLAYTPSQMSSLSQKGIPISAQSADESQYFDGVPSKDCVLDVEFERGFDLNTAWNMEQEARENIKHGAMANLAKKSIQNAVNSLSSQSTTE